MRSFIRELVAQQEMRNNSMGGGRTITDVETLTFPGSTTVPVVLPEAERERTAEMATYLAGMWRVSHMIQANSSRLDLETDGNLG